MTVEVSAKAADTPTNEEAIGLCVRRFYEEAQKDPLLAPVFEVSIADWEHHFSKLQDFWSRALLGTERYSGFPFPVHMQLPVEPEHFARWLALFEKTAAETLSPALAQTAIEKARHMATCFQAGIFPFVGKDGRPSRLPK
ncbi:MAG: group III truncated hemoglobin [Rhodomicrobium sp.]